MIIHKIESIIPEFKKNTCLCTLKRLPMNQGKLSKRIPKLGTSGQIFTLQRQASFYLFFSLVFQDL